MTERDVHAEIREWLTDLAVRWRDDGVAPTLAFPAHWGYQLRECGIRAELFRPGQFHTALYERIGPLAVTFYAVLRDGSEITVAADVAAGLADLHASPRCATGISGRTPPAR